MTKIIYIDGAGYIDDEGNITFEGVLVDEPLDPPDHDQWLRQIERVQKETGWKDIEE